MEAIIRVLVEYEYLNSFQFEFLYSFFSKSFQFEFSTMTKMTQWNEAAN